MQFLGASMTGPDGYPCTIITDLQPEPDPGFSFMGRRDSGC
jgi:hypothetical protein